jgi:hypothetical protein
MRRALLRIPLLLVGFLLSDLASAQPAIPDGAYNLWLAEQPIPSVPLFGARIAGAAHYRNFDAKATLAFFCRADSGPKSAIRADLAVDVKVLGFDSDPYEGPSATMNGPAAIVIGDRSATEKPKPVIQRPVGGFFGDGGAFDTGTPFIFSFSGLPMAQWMESSMRGKTLTITLPSAKSDAPLTFHFRLPEDDAVLKRTLAPCL